jgi:hypothetical protein
MCTEQHDQRQPRQPRCERLREIANEVGAETLDVRTDEHEQRAA